MPAADFNRDFCQPRDFLGQRLVEQFPVQPLGELFGDGAAARAKFPINEKDLFHIIVWSLFGHCHGVNRPWFCIKQNAKDAQSADTGHHEKQIHERPVVGLLEQRVDKASRAPAPERRRAEMLLEYFLSRCRLLLILRI